MDLSEVEQAGAFDQGQWLQRLHSLNDWANGAHAGDTFEAARKEACVRRWQNGAQVWNAWANEMFALRCEAKAANMWDYWGAAEEAGQNDVTQKWLALAAVDFTKFKFEGQATYNFADFEFPGRANFEAAWFGTATASGDAVFNGALFNSGGIFRNVQFSGEASFQNSQFDGRGVCFDNANFAGNASFFFTIFHKDERNEGVVFRRAQFNKRASFLGAQFLGSFALFNDAVFSAQTCFGAYGFQRVNFAGVVDFTDASFLNRADFVTTQFDGAATFKMKEVKGAIDFGGATFAQVPDFIGVELKEPPRLDNVTITSPMKGAKFGWCRAADGNAHARYRKLRKMAGAASDVENEVRFNAAEIECRRFWVDKPWPAAQGAGRFWVGWLYGFFSDCGQSLRKPLIALGFFLLAFALAFGSCSKRETIFNTADIADINRNSPPLQRITSRDFAGNLMLGVECQPSYIKHFAQQPTGMKWEGFLLSLRNTLIFDKADGSKRAHGCLYGVLENKEPVIPPWVTMLSSLQSFLSAVLIFLSGLAIRNMCRLK